MLYFNIIKKLCILLICCISSTILADVSCSTSIQADAEYLLETNDFMDSQYSMNVDGVEDNGTFITITTTGAMFKLDCINGEIFIWQRQGKKRLNSTIILHNEILNNLKIIRKGSGAVLLENSNVKIRINSDSLLMLKAKLKMQIKCVINFESKWTKQFYSSYLFLDEFGGFGAYPTTKGKAAPLLNLSSIQYTTSPNQIFWFSVAPPKPYDWEKNKDMNVIWHWSRKTGYPSDAKIKEWSQRGNILLQQAEVMLWQDWNLGFVPRNGLGEVHRVNSTCKENGVRNILYTSPYYFFKATPAVKRAINSFEGFVKFPKGEGTGRNWPYFIREIKNVMQKCKPDGLYFDGIYNNVVRTYIVTRKAREIVGDNGILEFHATGSAPGKFVYLPQIDTYYDIILRGEGHQNAYINDKYLRYFVSTYNISNSIGVLCNNNSYRLTEEFINKLLDLNIQLHCIPGAKYKTAMMDKYYWPVLKNCDMKTRVKVAQLKRCKLNSEMHKELSEDNKQNRNTADLQELVFKKQINKKSQGNDNDFALLSGKKWKLFFSKNSNGTFAAESNKIIIKANAHTCVYIEKTLPTDIECIQARIKSFKNCGQSWGPALVLRLGKQNMRIGLRSDDCIQLDGPDGQLFFYGYRRGEWHNLRIRLCANRCIYEVFKNKTWEILYIQTLYSQMNKVKKIAVGKIPYSGGNEEFKIPGKVGRCEFDNIKIMQTGKR